MVNRSLQPIDFLARDYTFLARKLFDVAGSFKHKV